LPPYYCRRHHHHHHYYKHSCVTVLAVDCSPATSDCHAWSLQQVRPRPLMVCHCSLFSYVILFFLRCPGKEFEDSTAGGTLLCSNLGQVINTDVTSIIRQCNLVLA